MIFNPMITVLVVSTITLVITGPIIQGFANGLAVLINDLVHASGWLGGLVIGAFYQVLVIFGLHWGVVPLVAQQIAGTHESALNAIISSTMVSQGAAVLAVAIKSHKKDTKSLGIAAAISAFCGVTEPAIYGINLRYRKVFISGLAGSGVGGLITGLMHGSMYGFTGSLIGFSSFFNPAHPTIKWRWARRLKRSNARGRSRIEVRLTIWQAVLEVFTTFPSSTLDHYKKK